MTWAVVWTVIILLAFIVLAVIGSREFQDLHRRRLDVADYENDQGLVEQLLWEHLSAKQFEEHEEKTTSGEWSAWGDSRRVWYVGNATQDTYEVDLGAGTVNEL
jgi:sensor domain CHASE-containing protein